MILSGMLVSVWILNTYKAEEQKLLMKSWKHKLCSPHRMLDSNTTESKTRHTKKATNKEIPKNNNQ